MSFWFPATSPRGYLLCRSVVSSAKADVPALLSVKSTAHWLATVAGVAAALVTSCPSTLAAASAYLSPLLSQETVSAFGLSQSEDAV